MVAPEICAGTPYGQKADIWALGCILFEMMCLGPPFQATVYRELVTKIKNVQLSRRLPLFFSEALRVLTLQMLSADPNGRPTAKQILDNPLLKRFDDILPIPSMPGVPMPQSIASQPAPPPLSLAPIPSQSISIPSVSSANELRPPQQTSASLSPQRPARLLPIPPAKLPSLRLQPDHAANPAVKEVAGSDSSEDVVVSSAPPYAPTGYSAMRRFSLRPEPPSIPSTSPISPKLPTKLPQSYHLPDLEARGQVLVQKPQPPPQQQPMSNQPSPTIQSPLPLRAPRLSEMSWDELAKQKNAARSHLVVPGSRSSVDMFPQQQHRRTGSDVTAEGARRSTIADLSAHSELKNKSAFDLRRPY